MSGLELILLPIGGFIISVVSHLLHYRAKKKDSKRIKDILEHTQPKIIFSSTGGSKLPTPKDGDELPEIELNEPYAPQIDEVPIFNVATGLTEYITLPANYRRV